jgi:hypothetical protein
MSAEREVSAAAVNEGPFRLRVRARDQAIICGTENQGAAAREQIRIDFEANGTGHFKDEPACELVDIGLYSGDAQRHGILLCIADEAVVRFRREPPVQVVTVPHKKAPSVGGMLPDSLSGRIFGVEASTLISERDSWATEAAVSKQMATTGKIHLRHIYVSTFLFLKCNLLTFATDRRACRLPKPQ